MGNIPSDSAYQASERVREFLALWGTKWKGAWDAIWSTANPNLTVVCARALQSPRRATRARAWDEQEGMGQPFRRGTRRGLDGRPSGWPNRTAAATNQGRAE